MSDEDVVIVKQKIDDIQDHVKTMNNEMGQLEGRMRKVEESIVKVVEGLEWVKKFQWMILTTAMGAFILAAIRTILKV